MKIRVVPSIYDQGQLKEYLARIAWSGSAPTPTLDCLRQLMEHHLRAIPFCNAFILYEDEPTNIDPQQLFERLVIRRGGFFCFGQNLLFREMLRLIGFRCYSTAARVNAKHASSEEVELGGLSHMCTFVSLQDDPARPDEEHLWLVDVGFGGPNLNQPIPLHDGAIVKGALNEWHRIALIEHPKSAFEPAALATASYPPPLGKAFALQYQARNPDGSAKHPWRICYAFNLNEMHASDYQLLHYAVCHIKPGLFTQNLLGSLHLAPAREGEPMRRITLFNDRMQEHRLGQEPIKTVFNTEKGRIEALRTKFGLGDLRNDAEDVIRRKGLAL